MNISYDSKYNGCAIYIRLNGMIECKYISTWEHFVGCNCVYFEVVYSTTWHKYVYRIFNKIMDYTNVWFAFLLWCAVSCLNWIHRCDRFIEIKEKTFSYISHIFPIFFVLLFQQVLKRNLNGENYWIILSYSIPFSWATLNQFEELRKYYVLYKRKNKEEVWLNRLSWFNVC